MLAGRMTTDAVAAELADADVLVAPSVPTKGGKREGIPVVLMEAMASGLPVVASRLSGIPELVTDERQWAARTTRATRPPSPMRSSASPAIRHSGAASGRPAATPCSDDFDVDRNAAALACGSGSDSRRAAGPAAAARPSATTSRRPSASPPHDSVPLLARQSAWSATRTSASRCLSRSREAPAAAAPAPPTSRRRSAWSSPRTTRNASIGATGRQPAGGRLPARQPRDRHRVRRVDRRDGRRRLSRRSDPRVRVLDLPRTGKARRSTPPSRPRPARSSSSRMRTRPTRPMRSASSFDPSRTPRWEAWRATRSTCRPPRRRGRQTRRRQRPSASGSAATGTSIAWSRTPRAWAAA